MRNRALKLGICLSLTAAVAVAGVNEARTTPFHLDHSVFKQIYNPTDRRASLDWMARLSDAPGEGNAIGAGIEPQSQWMARGLGSWRLVRFEGLVTARTEQTSLVEELRLVRLRASPISSTARSRHIDAGVFGASTRDRPISDVYDFARVESGKPAPITPVKMERKRKPEPTTRKTKRPRRSGNVLDVSIKTLDYVVLRTKFFVQNLSRILKSIM